MNCFLCKGMMVDGLTTYMADLETALLSLKMYLAIAVANVAKNPFQVILFKS